MAARAPSSPGVRSYHGTLRLTSKTTALDLIHPDQHEASILLPIYVLNMTDPAIQAAETIQTASINLSPSASRDINPPTSLSEKKPPVELTSSDADSIPSDLIDRPPAFRTPARRHTLPPLPDLRFEQSYLASLRGADTWGRVAWITIRDQVRAFPMGPPCVHCLVVSMRR